MQSELWEKEVIDRLKAENKRLKDENERLRGIDSALYAVEEANNGLSKQVKSLKEQLAAAERRLGEEYHNGYLDGITAYAWMNNGIYYVGSGNRTLKEAIDNAKSMYNYHPPVLTSPPAAEPGEMVLVRREDLEAMCGFYRIRKSERPVLDFEIETAKAYDHIQSALNPGGK